MDPVSGLILLVTLVVIGWATYLLFKKTPEGDSKGNGNTQTGKGKKEKTASNVEGKKGGKQAKGKDGQSQNDQKFTHPWLVSSLKGHTGNILDISLSPNDKFLASCADDRIAHVWVIKDLIEKDHKRIRVNFPFDHATLIRWSPDSKAFVVTRFEEKMLEVYKLGRKPDNSVGNIASALQWPQESGKTSDYIGLEIACNGKFIMSSTKDGEVILRDVKGSLLKKFYSGVANPVKAKVSPCGRYVVVAGSENMEIWEVKLVDSQGSIKEVTLKNQFNAFPQRGANVRGKTHVGPSIADFDMNADASKLVAVATNGKFAIFDASAGNKVFNEQEGDLELENSDDPIVTITNDARVVTIGANGGIYTFSSFSGKLLHEIPNIYKNQISRISCSSDNKYLVTAGDNVIFIFRNLSWYQDTIRHLRAQLNDDKITGALRTRMQTELSSLQEEFSKF